MYMHPVRRCTNLGHIGQCKAMENALFDGVPFSEDSEERQLFGQASGDSVTCPLAYSFLFDQNKLSAGTFKIIYGSPSSHPNAFVCG